MRKTTALIFFFLFPLTFSFAQTAKFVSLEASVANLVAANRWDDLLMTAPELITEDPTRGEGYYYTALAFCKLQSVNEAKEYLQLTETTTNSVDLAEKINALEVEVEALETHSAAKQNVDALKENATAEDYRRLWELDKSQLEHAISAIERYVDDEDFVAAIAILDDPMVSKDESARELRTRLNNTPKMKKINSYNAAMQAGESKFNARNYDGAIGDFETALRYFPNDPGANDYLRKSKEEALWKKATNSNYVDETENYVDKYPYGKYADAANATIRSSYISIAEKAFRESDETRMVEFHNKYLKRFPSDGGIQKIRSLLLDFYLNTGNKELAAKDWYDAKQNFQAYLNMSPSGASAEHCQKSIRKCDWKLKQTSSGFLAYSYDSVSPLGFSFGKLNKNGVGFYSTVKMNSGIFTTLNGTIDKAGNKVLTNYNEAQTHNRLKDTRHPNIAGSLGLTFKVVYPLFMYVGGGAIYSSIYTKWEAVDPNYVLKDVDRTYWLRSIHTTTFNFFPETGLILKPGRTFVLKYGVVHHKSIVHQLGLGFQL